MESKPLRQFRIRTYDPFRPDVQLLAKRVTIEPWQLPDGNVGQVLVAHDHDDQEVGRYHSKTEIDHHLEEDGIMPGEGEDA